MKYRYAACGLFLFALCPSLSSAITIERIAAIAGDDVITVQDLREEGGIRYAIEGKDLAYIDRAADREKRLEALTQDYNTFYQQAPALSGYLADRKNGIWWRPKPHNCEIRVFEAEGGKHRFIRQIRI